jgi:hypothetical protein
MSSQPPGNTYDIPKKSIFVKVKADATNLDIIKLTNNIVKVAGDSNVFAFDVRKFLSDLKEHMIIMYVASALIAVILFILTFF